ncbi:MAG: UvrB/UvrC motif-containing protein [Paludibacteraceae bacterium]|nr:UvrB/UvrC motif-containing protein [Paludibacteraceae bacterium]
MVAETMSTYNTPAELEKLIAQTKQAMLDAAKDLEFLEAARLRDEMIKLQNELLKMKK